MNSDSSASAGPTIEMFTLSKQQRTETYLRNSDPKKTLRVAIRSVCHNPRMNTVRTYDVFPKQELRIGDDAAGGPNIRRTVESVSFAPAPGRSRDQ